MRKFFVLFSLFFLIYSFASVATASEYMALNTDWGTDVFIRKLPTQKSEKIGIIWGTEFYGQSFIKPTGKTDGEWIQIESIYFGWPEKIKPEVRYGWVHRKYFRPALPKEEGFIFFQPTNYKIYGGIKIHETPNILDVSDFSYLNLATQSVFSMIGAKFIHQEEEWIEIEPIGHLAYISGYVLADYFGLKPEIETVIFKKPERYNIAKSWTYSHKGPDIRSYDVRSYNRFYRGEIGEVYIVGKKGHWMLTVNGDWVLAQHLVKFPLCLL